MLATAGLLIAGWEVLVHVSYPRGGGPALTDVLLLFTTLVRESALVRRYWAVACLILPVVGSLVGAGVARWQGLKHGRPARGATLRSGVR